MVTNPQDYEGITHDIHVRKPDDEIKRFEGVLDVMKIPSGAIKFHHKGELKQFSDGEIIRSRVSNADDCHKYVCDECESEEATLISSEDFGEDIDLDCPVCGTNGTFSRCNL